MMILSNWQARLVKARLRWGRHKRWVQTGYKAGAALYKLRTGEQYYDLDKERLRRIRKRRYNRRKEVDCQARGRWFLFRAQKTGVLDKRLLFRNYTMWSKMQI